jgi:ketosteroid isomerase-like protein
MDDQAPESTEEGRDPRLDVREVMHRYAHSVDRRDLDTYASCFAEEIVVTGYGTEVIHGRDPWIAYNRNALKRFGATHHQLGSQDVVVDGDRATMCSYLTATHVLADDPSTLAVLWGRYDDELELRSGRWVIVRHHLERLIPVSYLARRLPG